MKKHFTRDLRTRCDRSPAQGPPAGSMPVCFPPKEKTPSLKTTLGTAMTALLFLILPLRGYGQSPCNCVSVTTIGTTGQQTSIGGYANLLNACVFIKGTLVVDAPANWTNVRAHMEEGSTIL